MSLHPDSLAIMRHLKSVCYELIDPLEQAEWASWEEGMDTVDGWATIRAGFFLIGVHFAAVDGDLSDDEAGMISDVQHYFDPDDDLSDSLSKRQHRDILRNSLRKNSELLMNLQLPSPVVYLKAYDDAYGTDLAEKAKAMYFRFANAITKADGTITEEEQSAFSI